MGARHQGVHYSLGGRGFAAAKHPMHDVHLSFQFFTRAPSLVIMPAMTSFGMMACWQTASPTASQCRMSSFTAGDAKKPGRRQCRPLNVDADARCCLTLAAAVD